MEEAVEQRLQPHRLAAGFFLGATVALLLTSPSGGSGPHSVSPGWFGLWLASTLGSAPLGVMLLVAPSWRVLPIESRRGPAMAYLLAFCLNLLALAILVVSLDGMGPAICIPTIAALGLALLYLRLFPLRSAKGEDIFP